MDPIRQILDAALLLLERAEEMNRLGPDMARAYLVREPEALRLRQALLDAGITNRTTLEAFLWNRRAS